MLQPCQYEALSWKSVQLSYPLLSPPIPGLINVLSRASITCCCLISLFFYYHVTVSFLISMDFSYTKNYLSMFCHIYHCKTSLLMFKCLIINVSSFVVIGTQKNVRHQYNFYYYKILVAVRY